MGTFFYILKLLGYFRVNAADEAAGLDASHHGGSAYPVDLDDDNSHKGSSYDGKQYNKVSTLATFALPCAELNPCDMFSHLRNGMS